MNHSAASQTIPGNNIPTKVGNLWTARQRRGHSLHEISYRACFKPQLPEYFIRRYSNEGDNILDPFMGRGTTPLQAALMKRNGLGSDVNPLSAMLLRPRFAPPSLTDIEERLQDIPRSARVTVKDKELLVFFHPKTLTALVAFKKWFTRRDAEGTLDTVDDWLRMVVLNRLTGHSSGFLSVKTLPPNQSVSISSQKKINQKYQRTPEVKDIDKIILKKSQSLLRCGYPPVPFNHKHKVACAPAHSLSWLSDHEIDLLITSPPFLDVVNYYQDNWLRCWFAGIETENIHIDQHRNIDSWRHFIRRCFKEFARVLKPRGHIAFEVGEVRKGNVMLEREVASAVTGLPFSLKRLFINDQKFTKTSNCWGIANNKGGTLTNRIVLFQRH